MIITDFIPKTSPIIGEDNAKNLYIETIKQSMGYFYDQKVMPTGSEYLLVLENLLDLQYDKILLKKDLGKLNHLET